MHALTPQALTPGLAEAPQGLAVPRRLRGLDGRRPQRHRLAQPVPKRRPHPPSDEQWLTVPGLGPRLAPTSALATGALSRFPRVGHSASSGRGVESPTRSHGKRQGPGHGQKGQPSWAWASRAAAPLARRLPPAAPRLAQRQVAQSRNHLVLARPAGAQKRSRACADRRRDRVPSAATPALGCGRASRWVEAGGWGKSGVRPIPSDASQAPPRTDGLPPLGLMGRRLCREPDTRWTRAGEPCALSAVHAWPRQGPEGVLGQAPCQGPMSGAAARRHEALNLMGDWGGASEPTPRA